MQAMLSIALTTGALFVSSVFMVPPAHANVPVAPAALPMQAEAKKHLDMGLQAIQAKQWEKARTHLLLAWQKEKHFRIAANLGRVEIELKQFKLAAEHLDYCLHNDENESAGHKAAVRALFDLARTQVGTVDISTASPGATVLVDGEVVGHTPMAVVFVDPGKRTITARMAGKSFDEQSIEMVAGEQRDVFVPERISNPPKLRRATRSKDEGRWKIWAIPLGGALTVAGFGVGIAYTLAARKEGLSLEEYDDKVTGATIGYAVGGTALFTTVIMAVWPTEHRRNTGFFMAPIVGGDRNGVQVGGSF